MFVQTAVALASLAMSGLWTASDPFVGTWKLDTGKSLVLDQMQVEATGPDRYTFRFEGGPAETIVTDGTFQPGVLGTTLAVTAGAGAMRVERKKDGRTMLVAHWTLGAGARTLHDEFTTVNADGSTSVDHLVYQRKAGRSGFAGRWERMTPPSTAYELKIEPRAGAGLSFSALGAVKPVTFDGRDHAVPGQVEGATVSGRRSTGRALEMTDKVGGKVSDTRTYTLSRDGKVLTLVIRPAGQSKPNVLVYERA